MFNLDVQSYYHIELVSPWTDKVYDVLITGIASRSTVSELDQSANLKKEFFTEYNLGISKYLLLITDSTVIYTAKAIKQYEPEEVNDEKSFFIPSSLIDYTKTYKYTNAKRYEFNIKAGLVKFDNVLAEDEFIKAVSNSIRKKFEDIEAFASDNLSIQALSTDVISTNEKLTSLESARKKAVDLKNQSAKQYQENIESMERNLYSKTIEMEKSKTEYEAQRVALLSQISEVNLLQSKNEQENLRLNKVKTVMIEMINRIKNGEFLPENFPDFQTIYDMVVNGTTSSNI